MHVHAGMFFMWHHFPLLRIRDLLEIHSVKCCFSKLQYRSRRGLRNLEITHTRWYMYSFGVYVYKTCMEADVPASVYTQPLLTDCFLHLAAPISYVQSTKRLRLLIQRPPSAGI